MVFAQDQPPVEAAAPQDNSAQLLTCREGILDERARPEERRRWADLLFSYESPAARALVVEMLSLSSRPEVQLAMCEVLRDQARQRPERLDPMFVTPLVEMLGATGQELRSAAGRALADFPGREVPERLGAIAADGQAPLAKRLAAVDALIPNTHRREVVGQLVPLLKESAPREMIERVTQGLAPAADATYGADIAAWQAWWKRKSALSEETWVAEQLHLYRGRWRRLTDEFNAFRAESVAERGAITSQMQHFQRELFRALPAEQRQARLVRWIDDPMPVVKQTALSIIKAQIADEGKRPEGEVLAALLRQLPLSAPATKQEILLVVQTLKDPAVVDAVLAQLTTETDAPTRLALLKAIGRLNHPRAIPALVAELDSERSPMDCVAEAATALGLIATGGHAADQLEALRSAVAPLQRRCERAPASDRNLRAALLSAMAGVADPSFAPHLLSALESDDATLLQPALRGLRAIGDRSQLPRFRTLTAHPESLVRLAAIETVARLGREDADLESLLTRLNPGIESNELVREAAWRGFRELVGSRTVPDRIRAADRLRDMPELEIRYLNKLVDSLSTSSATAADADMVRDRLVTLLTRSGKFGEAMPHLRQLYQAHLGRNDRSAYNRGLQWLDAALRAAQPDEAADVVIALRQAAIDEAEYNRITQIVAQYLDAPDAVRDMDRYRNLLHALGTVPIGPWDDEWNALLRRASGRVQVGSGGPAPPR